MGDLTQVGGSLRFHSTGSYAGRSFDVVIGPDPTVRGEPSRSFYCCGASAARGCCDGFPPNGCVGAAAALHLRHRSVARMQLEVCDAMDAPTLPYAPPPLCDVMHAHKAVVAPAPPKHPHHTRRGAVS